MADNKNSEYDKFEDESLIVDADELWSDVLKSYESKNPASAERIERAAKEAGVPSAIPAASAKKTAAVKKESPKQSPAAEPAASSSKQSSAVKFTPKSRKAPEGKNRRKSSGSGRVQKISPDSKHAAKSGRKKPKKLDPKTKARKIRHFIICLLIWIIVIVLCCFAFKLGYDVFYDLPMDSADLTKIEVTIDGYETDDEVGKMLLENDLIDNLFIFKIRCLIYDSDYVAGTYSISRSYNTEKILNILAGYSYSDGTLEE